MNRKIVGLFSRPLGPELAGPRASLWHPWRLYRQAVYFKANPRDEGYMQALFAARYPEGIFVNADNTEQWRDLVAEADTVVLLYPDAIGLGFGGLEKKVRDLKKIWTSMRVLNGRRRNLLLNPSTLLGLRVRRLMERGMFGEMVAAVLFLMITPILMLKDLAGGRR